VERTISSILTYEPWHDLNLRDAQRAYLRLGSEVEVAQYVLLLIEDRGVQVVADRGCLWRYIPDTGLWTVLDRPEMTRIVQAIDGVGVGCGVNKTTGEPKYKPLKVSKALCDNVYALIGAFKARDGFFDAAPDALAFCNGVVTMGAGGVVSFEPKSPEWRQVHRLDFDWDEGAACPGFDRFLSEVVPADCADLLREWFGCALLGRSTDFAKALVLVGEGANGKSTLLNVIRALMPDGSVEAVAPQLMAQEYRRAKLAGCRLNVVNELPATEILEAEQVKAIISGDDIDARHIRMSPFSFKPRAGHVFAANELPGVRDMSRGFWRRWLVVPFAREFAEHEQDKGLSGRLIAGELPGVVASLVKAASAAVARGRFVEPAVASEEKTRWRHEADRVALFVSEKCSPCPAEDGCAAQQIHGAFTSWCTVNGYKPLNAVRFGKRLKRLGVTKVRTRDGARYGLEIKRGAHLSVV
jgi:putative DNA primase/helicase